MRPSFWLSLIMITLIASGCAGRKTRQAPPAAGGPAPVEGPQEVYSEPAPPPVMGPEPDSDYKPPTDSYVLILGPGLARDFADVGVLKELEQKQVRITGVVGVELGAVLGSIWASSSVNNLEWRAHRLTKRTLLDFSLLKIQNSPAPGKKIAAFIEDSVRVDDLAHMKTPVAVASSSQGGVVFDRQGSPKDVLRGALGIPNILQPAVVNGQERWSAGFELPYPVDYAKSLGLGKTLCVDVIGQGNDFSPKDSYDNQLYAQMRSVAVLAREQLKNCDETIRVATNGIGYLDFDQKAELISRGKDAVEKWIETKKK